MDFIKNENPLVSIIVITYNSSKFILETLESAKNQTYDSIELIISDDCSKDNTVQSINEWIEKHKERFVRTQLLKSPVNSGVSANCNRALQKVQGKWIKFIAGDDILLNNCISDNIEFVSDNKDISFVFSGFEIFSDNKNELNEKTLFVNLPFYNLSPKLQFRKLIKSNYLFAPSAFIKTETLHKLGGFDERVKNVEDYPVWLKATKNGFRLFYLSSTTIKYRIHSNSLTPFSSNKNIKSELSKIFRYYKLPNISFYNFFYILFSFLDTYIMNDKIYRIIKSIFSVFSFKTQNIVNQ